MYLKQNSFLIVWQVAFLFLYLLVFLNCCLALEPNEILIIANSDIPESVRIAKYYCDRRSVPEDNILTIALGPALTDTISRDDYKNKLTGPIRSRLAAPRFAGKIRCLLTTYGIPFRVAGRGTLKNQQQLLNKLQTLAQQEKEKLKQFELDTSAYALEQKKKIDANLARIQAVIDPIVGKETSAAVDSELSMVLFGGAPQTRKKRLGTREGYELYRWQPNRLKFKLPFWDYKSLMVSRLDAPEPSIVYRLIDKAIIAEKTTLKGIAYIDSRGIEDDKNPQSLGHYDQSLRNLAEMLKSQTQIPVIEEQTAGLFQPNQCQSAALYCGWYSLKKYIDAFDFVDGAVGYHIASWEAVNLRDANSTQWCPAMLTDGITATIGAVDEPYLGAFPEPEKFFAELISGSCLAEAFYHTKPYNSWQMILIADPLYTPFKTAVRSGSPKISTQ